MEYVLSSYDFPNNMIPVVSPIGVDKNGNKFNINADYAASYLANALNVDKLVYLTDQDGIYDKSGQCISEVSLEGLEKLIEDKVVNGGMLTKVKTIISSLKGGLNQVHILDGNHKHAMLTEIFTEVGVGTLCSKKVKIKETA